MASPKLRFKEFSLDWELKSLGSITKWYSGGTPSKDIEDYWGNGYPLISGASMHADLLEEYNVHITELGLQNGSKLAPKNSILLLVRGSMLFNRIPVGIAQKDLAFNQDVKCLIPSNGVLYQFIFQWFKSKENFIKNKVTSTGIGAGKLDTDDLQNLSFFQPTEKEQAKIASFLTTIDKKISQLNEQHQLMIQYKKGVMQKIFNQEIRFKDDNGEEFGEWEEKILGEISNPQQWKTISSSDMTESGYPVFGANGYIGFYSEYNHENETITVTCRGATCGEVTLVKPKTYITGNSMSIDDIDEQKYSVKFIYYALCIRGFSDVITGSAQPQIVGSSIKKVKFLVPCIKEQSEIANFLTWIDQRIENLAQQLEQAKNWKKGLLQQMFV